MAQSLAQFGQTIKAKHPEYHDLSDEDVATKVLAKYPQYRDMVETVAGAGPLGLPQPKNPTVDMQAPALGSAPQIASDVAAGALKGAGRTANNIGKLIIPDAAVRAVGATVPQGTPSILQPTNTAQKIGGGIEQAAEFLVPGGAEESLAAKAAPYVGKALPAVKMGLAALGSGAVNKAQEGSFGAGALAGGVGSGVAQGLKAVAPAIAESALNIRKLDRAYKPPQAIGKAILNETTGFTPSAIADSAQGVLNRLNPELEVAAVRATAPASLNPARTVVSDAVDKATRQGERTTFSQLQPMGQHLGETMFGQPIPADVPAHELLNLKRGFGNEFIHRWNPETMTGVKGTAGQVYHAMGDEFNRVVPEAGPLNSRISSLIPVAKRAESLELNAPTAQKVAGRIAAHTGALTGGVFGAKEGYDKGGVGGALFGGTIGLAAPEMLASPTGQMFAARSFNSPAVERAIRLLVGGGLQLKQNPAQRSGNDESQ